MDQSHPCAVRRHRRRVLPGAGRHCGAFLEERGERQIPATLLSDGTLRYLSLLAVLLHPEPPPLIAFEEPDLGLHPDVVAAAAKLLVQVSRRTQIVVTTPRACSGCPF